MSDKPTEETGATAPDLATILTYLKSIETKQKATNDIVTNLQGKMESLELGQSLLESASPTTAAQSRPSSERRATIIDGKLENADGSTMRAVIQPRSIIAHKDLQEYSTISATRRTLRLQANHNSTNDEDRKLHEFLRSSLIQQIVDDQRVRGKHVHEDFKIETFRKNYSDEEIQDMLAALVRSGLKDQSAKSYIMAVIHSVPPIKPVTSGWTFKVRDFDIEAYPRVVKFIEDIVDNLYFLYRGLTISETTHLPALNYGSKDEPGWAFYIMTALDLNPDFMLRRHFMIALPERKLKDLKDVKELRKELLAEASRIATMAREEKTKEASVMVLPTGEKLLDELRRKTPHHSSTEGTHSSTEERRTPQRPNNFQRGYGNAHLRSVEMLSPGSTNEEPIHPINSSDQEDGQEPDEESFMDADEFDDDAFYSMEHLMNGYSEGELNAMVKAGFTPTRIFTRPNDRSDAKFPKPKVANAACYQHIFGKCDKGEHCRFSHSKDDGVNMIKRYIRDAMRAPFGGFEFVKNEADNYRIEQQKVKFASPNSHGHNKKIAAVEESSRSANNNNS